MAWIEYVTLAARSREIHAQKGHQGQRLIYITEMAFADPSRLAEWHAHYLRNIANLQTVPGFLASQRFESLAATPSPYSALHEIASADVFESAIYQQRGGRASNGAWQKDMINWHRNLYSGLDATPEVADGAYLLFIDEQREIAERELVLPAGVQVHWLLAWARAGHDINFGSGGIGSAQHVLMEMLSRSAGLRLTHVPYRGVIPAMNDVIAGHIPVMIVGLAGSLGAIRSGLLRAIAMPGPKRAAELPDVPTLAEKGLAGFPAEPWTAFFAPAATPAPILARLSGGLVEALNDAGVREKLKPVMAVETSTPEALRGMVERDIERYAKLVRDVGMKAE